MASTKYNFNSTSFFHCNLLMGRPYQISDIRRTVSLCWLKNFNHNLGAVVIFFPGEVSHITAFG